MLPGTIPSGRGSGRLGKGLNRLGSAIPRRRPDMVDKVGAFWLGQPDGCPALPTIIDAGAKSYSTRQAEGEQASA
jgi:hypothetical protein